MTKEREAADRLAEAGKRRRAVRPMLDHKLNREQAIRFVRNIEPGPMFNGSSCWVWTGQTGRRGGYGQFCYRDFQPVAHRVMYTAVHGPIPEGLTLDHLCRNPPCVNPKHMEVVSHKVNILRGISPSAVNAVKTTCPKGHAYDMTAKRPDGRTYRRCSECRTGQRRARWHERKS